MEQVIAGVIEKTLVGGAFLFLLYNYVKKVVVTNDKIVQTLGEISATLVTMNHRIERVEDELEILKGGVKHG